MNVNPMYGGSGMQSRPPIPRQSAEAMLDPTQLNGVSRGRNTDILTAANNGTLQGFSPKSVDDYNEHLRNNVARVMERLGMTLEDGEQLQLFIGPDNMISVAGLKDPAKAAALARELNTVRAVSVAGTKEEKSVQKNVYDNAFYINSDYARQARDFDEARARADLIRLKNTAGDAVYKQTGVELDFSSLSRDDSGKVAGYPDALAWIFEGNYNMSPQTDADKERYATARSVNGIVNRLLDAGYDAIPAVGELGVSFTFGGKDLELRAR